MPVFKNKDGQLSIYSLNCGYIQVIREGQKELTLYADGCIHVRAHDHDNWDVKTWDRLENLSEGRAVWLEKAVSFLGITKTEAKKRIK